MIWGRIDECFLRQRAWAGAERLDCAGFSPALERAVIFRLKEISRPAKSAAQADAVQTLRDLGDVSQPVAADDVGAPACSRLWTFEHRSCA